MAGAAGGGPCVHLARRLVAQRATMRAALDALHDSRPGFAAALLADELEFGNVPERSGKSAGQPRLRGVPLTVEQVREFVRLYEQGVRPSVLAAKFGVHPTTVYRRINELGSRRTG